MANLQVVDQFGNRLVDQAANLIVVPESIGPARVAVTEASFHLGSIRAEAVIYAVSLSEGARFAVFLNAERQISALSVADVARHSTMNVAETVAHRVAVADVAISRSASFEI